MAGSRGIGELSFDESWSITLSKRLRGRISASDDDADDNAPPAKPGRTHFHQYPTVIPKVLGTSRTLWSARGQRRRSTAAGGDDDLARSYFK